ncbi:OmpH family outer membrane protein, partial [Candidatus Dependentiae bacterium]|nr:OmpH family outer membrane protein [Candidatus Dependentiae bacterium]
LAAFVSSAGYSADIKYGYVDSQEVADEHPVYKEKLKEIEKIVKPQRDKIQEKQKELEKLNAELENNPLASDDVIKAKKMNFEKKYDEYKKMVEAMQREVQKRESETLPEDLKRKILEEVMTAIQGIAKREGFQIIYEINKANIIYIEPSLDLTERSKTELINSLNKKTSK